MMRCLVLFLCFLSVSALSPLKSKGHTKSESFEAAGEEDVLEAEKVSDSTEEEDEAPRKSRSGAVPSGAGASSGGGAVSSGGGGAASSGGGGGAAGGGSQGGGGSAVTVSPTTTAASSNTATHLTCTFPDHYCNPTAEDLIRKVEDQTITDAAHCKRLCAEYRDNSGAAVCKDFTYFNFRGIETCFLLTGCNDKRPKCTVPDSCVSGKTSCTEVEMCDKLTRTPGMMRWRCQGGINPYTEDIPVGTPCYTYCPSWINQDKKNFVVKSICEGASNGNTDKDAQWGDPKYFPPGVPEFPVSLEKPTKDIPQCSCSALKLPYDPNTELGGKVAMFYCFTLNNGVETPKNIDWTQLPATAVEIDTTDRCHLFCDKMLISITECKEGVWTGRPDKGFWCTEDPAINDATKKITYVNPKHGDTIHVKKSNKPRKSENQEAAGDYGKTLHEKHHFNNFYDNDQTYENLNKP